MIKKFEDFNFKRPQLDSTDSGGGGEEKEEELTRLEKKEIALKEHYVDYLINGNDEIFSDEEKEAKSLLKEISDLQSKEGTGSSDLKKMVLKAKDICSDIDLPIIYLHDISRNLSVFLQKEGEFKETIQWLSEQIDDDSFSESSKNIELIANLISNRGLSDIIYNVDYKETLPSLVFLNNKAENLNNYLLRNQMIEILDFSFSGIGRREFPAVDRSYVDEDVKESIKNLRRYGLLSDHRISLAQQAEGNYEGAEYLGYLISSASDGGIYLKYKFDDKPAEKIECPKKRMAIAKSPAVYNMAQEVEHDYLLLDLSPEYMGVFDHQGRLYKYFKKRDPEKTESLEAKDILDLESIEDIINVYYEENPGLKSDIVEAFRISSQLPL